MIDPLSDRKKLTFEQAEGLAVLPTQLQQGTISREFRALLWAELHSRFETSRHMIGGTSYTSSNWTDVLRDAHVRRDHLPIDEYSPKYYEILKRVKSLAFERTWSELLGWLEFLLKHPKIPANFSDSLDKLMAECHLAYRVFDKVVICPIGSEAERTALSTAFTDLATSEFNGARAHLRKAGDLLTGGQYADSVRESIHAVEATARVLEPTAALASALGRLEQSAKIHKALKHGFQNLYGYTSDEKGIRHPLLDDGSARVDETDALFMIGACASFVSYLINKARSAGILK